MKIDGILRALRDHAESIMTKRPYAHTAHTVHAHQLPQNVKQVTLGHTATRGTEGLAEHAPLSDGGAGPLSADYYYILASHPCTQIFSCFGPKSTHALPCAPSAFRSRHPTNCTTKSHTAEEHLQRFLPPFPIWLGDRGPHRRSLPLHKNETSLRRLLDCATVVCAPKQHSKMHKKGNHRLSLSRTHSSSNSVMRKYVETFRRTGYSKYTCARNSSGTWQYWSDQDTTGLTKILRRVSFWEIRGRYNR